MKKLFLLAVISLSVAFVSCAKPSEGSAEATSESASQAPKNTASDGIVYVKDAKAYKPGQKVDRLTIIDFNAVWCGPCRAFKPLFEQAAKEYGKKVTFVSVDIDQVPELANAFKIQAVPTLIFMCPDGTSTKFVGTQDLMPYEKFKALIDKNLK